MNDKIETNQTEENINAPVKRGRGRPIDLTKTRILRRDLKTGKIFSKGRLPEGLEIEEITVHRGEDSLSYIEGTTPVISRKIVAFHSKKKDKPPVANNINVIVTNPNEVIEREEAKLVEHFGETDTIVHEDMAVS